MNLAYLSPQYAQSLAEFGTLIHLPRSGGWLLRRAIPGTDAYDAMGCYPMFACEDWRALRADLLTLGDELVSVSLVPDPFGDYRIEDLHAAFPDRMIAFKPHYIADLHLPTEVIVSRHHRKYARRALARMQVEFPARPIEHLALWNELFQSSIDRFHMQGVRSFSPACFAQQLALPGAVLSLAYHEGEPVAAHFYLLGGDVAYAHLSAATDTGRALGADYAIYHSYINHMRNQVRWIDWGGEVGLATDGPLSQFKRGWSSTTRQAYFCGRILNAERYARLSAAAGTSESEFFPAYRAASGRSA